MTNPFARIPWASVLLVVGFSFVLKVSSQDNLGMAGSSYSPVNTVWNNPATIVDSKAFIDFQLAGLSFFARNDLAYYPGGEFSLSNLNSLPPPSFNENRAPYHGYVSAQIAGPSVTFAVKQHAFGLHSRVRMVADARGITETLRNQLMTGFQDSGQMGREQQISGARVNALAWMETGISYGTIISRGGDMITQAAISVRRLNALAGAGMRIDQWEYSMSDSSRMYTSRFAGEYGFTEIDGVNKGRSGGSGWSGDIGILFKQRLDDAEDYKPHSPCTDGDYRYRFGFSVMDIGAVRFKGPYYRNVVDQNQSAQWDDFTSMSPDQVADLDSLINTGLGATKENSKNERFVMMLPTRVSAQFDYNFNHGLYLHAMISGGVPWKGRLGVQGASYLAVIPRWEKKRFEVALPVSMYEFQHPQVGLMLRLNSLIIGSDNLGWLLFDQKMYGADIYCSLKYTIFKHWKCGEKKIRRTKLKLVKKTSPPPCPGW